MIPDFKTYIGESVWGDIHKRANGEKARKEDDYIDKLNFNEFIQYLDDTYKSTDSSVENIDVHPSFSNPSLQLIQIPIEKIGVIIPPVTIKYQTKGTGFNSYDVEKPSCVAISSILFKSYPELVGNLEREYDLEYPTSSKSYIVDTKSGPMKNSDCIKILDIVLSMVKEPVVIKKLGESVWGDIYKRSNGIQVKKEDDIDHLDWSDFYEYIVHNYQSDVYNTIRYNPDAGYISVPVLRRAMSVTYCVRVDYKDGEPYVHMNSEITKKFPDLISKIKDKFKTEYVRVHEFYIKIIISPADGSGYSNTHFLNVVNFILDNTDEKYHTVSHK